MSAFKNTVGCYTSTRLAANATTQVYTASGNGNAILKRVVVTDPGASSNTITIYDNTSTTGTAIFDLAPTAAGVWDLDIRCDVGIRVVIATGTAGHYYIIWA